MHLDVKFVFLNGPLQKEVAVTPSETNHELDSDPKSGNVDATTFRQLIDSMRYLCNIMHDIYNAVGMINKFMSKYSLIKHITKN